MNTQEALETKSNVIEFVKRDDEKPKSKRVRRMKILQYEFNPKTKESLNFNESNIINALDKLSHRLKRWAWVCHDKDVVTEADIVDSAIEEDNQYTVADLGKPKGKHWHIAIELNNPAQMSAIANLFGVPVQFVESIEGGSKSHDAFLDVVYYFTHEDEKQQQYGKHEYAREEVNVHDESLWQAIDMQVARESLKQGGIRGDVRVMIKRISNGELTLKQAYQQDEIMFVENIHQFKTARQQYLKNSPVPKIRTNYFITGEGGAGKSLSAKLFARAIRPDIEDDEELFFTVGDGAVPFDGYDGQPIIIWDDWRSIDLLDKFDRSMVWKLFAINPERIDVNIKYGSMRLINTINIVTSVQSYFDFNDGLCGEYTDRKGVVHLSEDKKQAYRRFPFFIDVTKDAIELAKVRGLGDDEMKLYDSILKFENHAYSLTRHQEQGKRKEVAEIMSKPLGLLTEVAESYQQGRADDELTPLEDIKLFDDFD